MKFLRDNWFRLGVIVFAALSYYMIFWGCDQLSPIQKILMASLMVLPIHQYEEYVFSGGGPVVINRGFYGEQTLYRQYPGNWNSIMIVNLSAYIFYILALVFPQAIWLGIATMLFNLFQLLGHALEMNIKLKTWYNPGLLTAVFGLLPISLWYFSQVWEQHLYSWEDVGLAIVWIGFNYWLAFRSLIYKKLGKLSDRYGFTDAEVSRGKRYMK